MTHNLDCPHCKTSMIKSYSDETKLRLKLIVWRKDGMFAVCKSCNEEVRITADLLKSIESSFVFEIPSEKES